MKKKISVTLEDSVLSALDGLASPAHSRSEMVEEAVAAYVARKQQTKKDQKERALLDRLASKLNEEAEDVLSYQEFP